MLVKVHWKQLASSEDEDWHSGCCLYAYATTKLDEIFYIGKADRASIYQRWKAKDKQNLFSALETERRIFKHIVLPGYLELELGRKFSWQLLSDVESLLIHWEQPWGNIQCKQTRISRNDLKVKCLGSWIGNFKTYTDY